MKPRIQVKSSIALAVILAAPRLGAMESSAPKVSEKQLQALTSNAKTPEDDQKLADYYRQHAMAFAQKSKEHTEMPEKWPVRGMPKQLTFAPGHCRYFAGLYAREAPRCRGVGFAPRRHGQSGG